MLLSVVVVNWNSRDDLRQCLESLERQTHRDLEIIVIDNGSTDGSVEMVRQRFAAFTLLPQNDNLGFAEACNRGIDASRAPWVAMLNNDAAAEPDWAAALVRAAERAAPDVGMLQSLLLFRDQPDVVNSTGIELTHFGEGRDRQERMPRADVSRVEEEIFCPTAGAAAYRRSMLDAIKLESGYFDSDYFMYSEDMDLGWRARIAGWTARFVPDSVVLHAYQGSTRRRGKDWLIVTTRTNRARTLLKNASVPFLLRTASRSWEMFRELYASGGMDGARGLAAAIRVSLRVRGRVSAHAQVSRRAIEKQWVRY